MKKILSGTALAAALSVVSAAPAFAIGVTSAINGSLNSATHTGSASSSASGSSRADADADVTVGVDASLNAGANSNTNVSAGLMTGSAQVQTDSDLDTYSMTVKQQDSSVSSVSSSDNDVSVEYHVPAKLFGFISVNMPEKASVSVDSQNETSVSVHRPWWSVFASVNGHTTESLQSRIKAHVPSALPTSASGTASLNASTKAQFISAIETGAHEVFGASSKTSAGTSASGSGSVSY